MADKPKKYCDGIDCAFCSEKEPCIYKIANRLESELYKLKAENEELKEKIAFGNNGTLSDKIRVEVFKELNSENNKLKQRIIEIDRSYKNRQEELEQTLTEIKEICKFNFTMTTTNLLAKTILQKISEVIEDENI